MQQEQLDKQRREWLKTLERAGIERRYQSCTVDKIAAKEVPPQVTGEYQRVRQYAEQIGAHVRQAPGWRCSVRSAR